MINSLCFKIKPEFIECSFPNFSSTCISLQDCIWLPYNITFAKRMEVLISCLLFYFFFAFWDNYSLAWACMTWLPDRYTHCQLVLRLIIVLISLSSEGNNKREGRYPNKREFGSNKSDRIKTDPAPKNVQLKTDWARCICMWMNVE